jgi:hypothetical protein
VKAANPPLTLATVRSLVRYDEASGFFTRLKSTGGKRVGSVAGTCRCDGYVEVTICRYTVLAHRLAWFYTHGEWPTQELDHRNGDRGDNALSNLRQADRSLNNQNRHGAHSNNRLRVMGVTRTRLGKFVARIRVDGRLIHLGTFATSAEASKAYLKAKRQMHGGNTL